jgi:branched-chain amino acid transport system permease protein
VGLVAALLAVAPLFLNAYQVDVLNSIGSVCAAGAGPQSDSGRGGVVQYGPRRLLCDGRLYRRHSQHPLSDSDSVDVAAERSGRWRLFALAVARPVVHLRGDYLLIVTIGVGEIVRIALVNDVFGITGGANGIFGISRPKLFGFVIRRPQEFFYLIWGFVALTIFLFLRLKQSRFGRALNYLREDEVAAEGSGINTDYYKLAVFGLGAAWAGMAGTLFAAKMTIISPESFSFWESVVLFMIVILGGAGSIRACCWRRFWSSACRNCSANSPARECWCSAW